MRSRKVIKFNKVFHVFSIHTKQFFSVFLMITMTGGNAGNENSFGQYFQNSRSAFPFKLKFVASHENKFVMKSHEASQNFFFEQKFDPTIKDQMAKSFVRSETPIVSKMNARRSYASGNSKHLSIFELSSRFFFIFHSKLCNSRTFLPASTRNLTPNCVELETLIWPNASLFFISINFLDFVASFNVVASMIPLSLLMLVACFIHPRRRRMQ